MEEEWRDVAGYEGWYQVSDEGRVRCLKRRLKNGGVFVYEEPLIRMLRGTDKGYLQVTLFDGAKRKDFAVHRLVAQAFIPNPLNLPEVNHRNEVKSDNRAENLEWCSRKYNMNYGSAKHRSKMNNPNRRDVEQYTRDGVFVMRYHSSMDAHRETGIDNSAITKCCLKRKNFNTAGGYLWRYAE